MQLQIRGNSNYVLEFATGNESCAEMKAQIAEREGSEDVLLYVAGKPVDYEMPVSSIGEFHIDVTVPLLGGKVKIATIHLLCDNILNFFNLMEWQEI